VNDDGAAAKEFDASPGATNCSNKAVSTVAIMLLVVTIASLVAAKELVVHPVGGIIGDQRHVAVDRAPRGRGCWQFGAAFS